MNEDLRNLLLSIELKLGGLVQYENFLIKEATILREMYEGSAESIKRTEELLNEFEKQRIYFFSDFVSRIDSAMESKLRDLLSEYNINITLSKQEEKPNELIK
jgi:hypothetical protein